MYNIRNFTPRDYQLNILERCKNINCLVCLPTGTGKTKLAILVALERLNKFSGSKILFLTPTKPLASQICNEFIESTDIDYKKIALLTGAIISKNRKEIYKNSVIIVATPQTIENDVKNQNIDLDEFSLLVVDECHKSRENFANTKVAEKYFSDKDSKRILALTASPGSDKNKINEICNNLHLKSVEILTEEDEDLKKHIQEKDIINIYVDFPEEFRNIHNLMKEEYRSKLNKIKEFGITKPLSVINKTDLVNLQRRFIKDLNKKNPSTFYGLSLVSQLLKLSYCLELLETQSLNALNDFIIKLESDTSKAAKNILSSSNIQKAILNVNELRNKNIKHPKIIKLKSLLSEEILNNEKYKAIVFANYRNTIDEIISELKDINIKTERFLNQTNKKSHGLNQKEQANIIEQFKNGSFNILVASSVAEEGIDIPEVNAVIFYEPIGSELRKIQRAGRTGRTKPGKIIFLITKETRDVGLFFSSMRKEKKMKNTLNKMKGENIFSKYEQ